MMRYGWGWPGNWGSMMGGYGTGLVWWLGPLVILDLVLKGIALWRAGRNGQKWWFVALLLVNSVGILPGIYLLTHPESKSHK